MARNVKAKRAVNDEPTPADFEAVAEAMKALGDPNRLRLLRIVVAKPDSCIIDLVPVMGLAQPTISHHMKVLNDAGLVKRDKRGVFAHWTINADGIAQLAPTAIRELIGL